MSAGDGMVGRVGGGGGGGSLRTSGVASRSLCSHISLSVRLADLALRLVLSQVSAVIHVCMGSIFD